MRSRAKLLVKAPGHAEGCAIAKDTLYFEEFDYAMR